MKRADPLEGAAGNHAGPETAGGTLDRFEFLWRGDARPFAIFFKHPIAAMVLKVVNDPLLGANLAWRMAREVPGTLAPPGAPLSDREAVRRLQERVRAEGRAWSRADPSEMNLYKGPFLYFLVRLLKPQSVVETGVASGVSSTYILQALSDNGHGRLASIDLPNADPAAAVPDSAGAGWIVPRELRRLWSLHVGDARALLPEILHRHGIDLFVHDSRHTYDHMLWEFETAWPHLRPSGLMIADDILWNYAFLDFCRRQGLREFMAFPGGMGVARKPIASQAGLQEVG